MKHLILSLILAVSAFESEALTITESFSSRANYASGTAVWNQALGAIHPTLEVINFKFGYTPADALAIDVGDGSDGPFDSSTYALFSVGGVTPGNVITIDTTVHPELQVTHFELDKNWYIETVGSNPLVIRSLSHVRILGEIRCQGGNGGDAVGATGGSAGQGRCGGYDGGAGGASNGAGNDGQPFAGAMTGGKGGNFVPASFVGGGGGGSWSSIIPPVSGVNSSGAGGQAGSYTSDPEFTTVAGGGGGGGGSGDGIVGGGGGGGGGGVVRIYAVGDLDFGSTTESAVGFIFVNGGDGGNSPSGGAGAGGGGGSIQAFVGGGINFYNVSTSASRATGGVGGTGGGAGAAGGLGRSWFGSALGRGGPGNYTPSEEFPVNQSDVNFVTTQQNVITRVYDLGNSTRTLTNLTLAPSSPDFTIEVAGSSDNFAVDDTGYSTTLSSVSGKQYVRFRIAIQTSDPVNPTMIGSAMAIFTGTTTEDFSFRSAGCGSVNVNTSGKGGSPLQLLPLLLALLIFVGLKIYTERKLSGKKAGLPT